MSAAKTLRADSAHALLEETAHIPVIVGELCDEAYLRRQVNFLEQRDLADVLAAASERCRLS